MSSATRLKPFRTTAFKLAAGYLVVFGVFAGGLIGYLVWETSSVIIRDVDQRLTADARRLGLHYQRAGINGLFTAMQQSAERPGNRLYALRTPDGIDIVNSVGELPDEVWQEAGLARFAYEQTGPDGEQRDSRAIVRIIVLPDGFRALIGQDIGQSDVIRQAIGRAAMVSAVLLVVLALLGWLYVNKRVLRRLDGISQTTARIMDGHLSERIAVMDRGDEFDRLADQLNAMLDRLERLMNSLKEVSDNIAHDLRPPADPDTDRAALEHALGEAERLMATFQALLTIARVEAGGRRHTLSQVDLSTVLTDVAELYEPVAEDQGVQLSYTAPPKPVRATVNRELVGLAVANLVDNALKYGPAEGGQVTLGLAQTEHSATITVIDNGMGIPAEDRQRVRDRFVRLDKSRTAEGSGLGLALVEAVASFHDGSIELSDAEPGLKATLRVPLGEVS